MQGYGMERASELLHVESLALAVPTGKAESSQLQSYLACVCARFSKGSNTEKPEQVAETVVVRYGHSCLRYRHKPNNVRCWSAKIGGAARLEKSSASIEFRERQTRSAGMMGATLPGSVKDVLCAPSQRRHVTQTRWDTFGTTGKAHIAAIDVKHWDEISVRVYPCWEH